MIKPAIMTAAVFALGIAGAPGCAVHAYGEPVADAYVYEDAPPVNVYAAPRVYYQDQWTYYVGGHWYRETPRGWAYYRQEPTELSRHRHYVQEAPPARTYAAPYVTSAPVYRGERVQEAPRAR